MVKRSVDATRVAARELYDIPRVASLLSVKESFVRSLVAHRRIPFLKIGKFIRFDPAQLGEWLDRRRADELP
jgi:excisionase family DNA binding protein